MHYCQQTVSVPNRYLAEQSKKALPNQNKLKKKYNKVWISNNVSTFISQTIDTLLFVLLSFIGIMNTNDIIQMIITMLLFKWGIALFDTPFMLLTTKIKNNELD